MPQNIDPSPDEAQLVLINKQTLASALRLISGCEGCRSDAQIPFDCVLDRVTGKDPAMTDYLLEAPAYCPRCEREITESTLILFNPSHAEGRRR